MARAIFSRLRLCGLFGLFVGLVAGLLLDLLRLFSEFTLADVPALTAIIAIASWIAAAVIVLMMEGIPVIPNALASFGNALFVTAITSVVMVFLPAPLGVAVGGVTGAVVGNLLCSLCRYRDRKAQGSGKRTPAQRREEVR